MNKNSSTCQWTQEHFEVTLVSTPFGLALWPVSIWKLMSLPTQPLLLCPSFQSLIMVNDAIARTQSSSVSSRTSRQSSQRILHKERDPITLSLKFEGRPVNANWYSTVFSICNKYSLYILPVVPLWKCSSDRPVSLAGIIFAHPNYK